MKLSISNIGWLLEYDEEMYRFLSSIGFHGVEIAPTRIFQDSPYDKLNEARRFARTLKETNGLSISSMQSIWYGVTESIFGSDNQRKGLVDYTKKAIDFAVTIGCSNLVFGCPKNRAVPENMAPEIYLPIAHEFFNEIGVYAAENSVSISIEPNPVIYNTNFINTTEEAFALCEALNNSGIRVNIDLGTMIYYGESSKTLRDGIRFINHVHVSEPHLVPIERRALHRELITELHDLGYDKFISIEMCNQSNIEVIKNTILYVKEIYDEL